MKFLLSKEGLYQLKKLNKATTLFAFDFDGTLCAINHSPRKAALNKKVARQLEELSSQGPIAIITGRSYKDIKSKLPFTPTYIIGNHGIESFKKNPLLNKAKKECQLWMAKLAKVPWQKGIFIEYKTYSLTFHYRQCQNPVLAKKQILKELQKAAPKCQLIFGKSIINVLHEKSPNKSHAVEMLFKIKNIKNVFYIGDDDTDEKVFNLNHPGLFTVRVGKKKKSQAAFYLQRQSQISSLLKLLLQLP